MKQFIKSLIPPILINTVQKYRNKKYGWKGDYSTWQQAKCDSTGYDTDKILQTVKNALLSVKKGEVVYERDSVLFDEIQYSWPLLSGVLLASVKGGAVKVLDFGGSLGSSYYQNKKFLDQVDHVSWSIVEQANFVDAGKDAFEDERLKFFYSVDECLKKESPNVLLLSSVLQYIEEPYALLDEILTHNFEYILIDRTPFNMKPEDTIKLQVVSPEIYEASYPCWFFNKIFLMDYFIHNKYEIIESFDGADGRGDDYEFGGMIFKKYD